MVVILLNFKAESRDQVMELFGEYKIKNQMINGIEIISSVDLTFSGFNEILAKRIFANKVNFKASTLSHNTFRDCEFIGSKFENCNLDYTNISDCVITEAKFYKAQMKCIEIKVSTCINTCFDEAILVMGDLSGSNFTGATFRGTNLTDCNADEAFFDKADFTGAILNNANFETSDLIEARLNKVNAKNTSFKSANLSGADLSNGIFEGANFTNAILENVNWKGAVIHGATFDEHVLEEVLKQM